MIKEKLDYLLERKKKLKNKLSIKKNEGKCNVFNAKKKKNYMNFINATIVAKEIKTLLKNLKIELVG